MRISQEADYAIRIVLYLSEQVPGHIAGAKTIAEQESVSLRFLLKILRKLVQAGLVQSFRGTNGGYSLARLPEETNLKEVIEAIDGPICINRCLYDAEYCNRRYASHCRVHRVLASVNRKLTEELESITLRNIAEQECRQ